MSGAAYARSGTRETRQLYSNLATSMKIATLLMCVFLAATSSKASYLEFSGYVSTIDGPNSSPEVQVGDPFHARFDYVVATSDSIAYGINQKVGWLLSETVTLDGHEYWIVPLDLKVTTPWGVWSEGGVDNYVMDLQPDLSVENFAIGGCCYLDQYLQFNYNFAIATGEWGEYGGNGIINGPISIAISAMTPEPNNAFLILFGLGIVSLLQIRRIRLIRPIGS
jgi:hypothetical protein